MKCPFCAELDNKVIDSRLGKDSRSIRRRRECIVCGRRFTTYEKLENVLPVVVKKDHSREPFDRDKIISGITIACRKRPISTIQIDEFADAIENFFQETGRKEISSSEIGEKVIEKLKEWDEVAYVRFASVYRQFRDISEFMDELENMKKSRRLSEINKNQLGLNFISKDDIV